MVAHSLTEKPVPELQSLIPPLLELCRRAGDSICRHYHSPEATEFSSKGDDSPLTQADLDSHQILEHGLLELGLELGLELPILSEESAVVEPGERRSWQRYWLVDPLDGTKEFLARTGEFTINIALIDHQRPILGVLYQPLEQLAWVGVPGLQSRCYSVASDGQWSARETAASGLQEGLPLTVLASRRHGGPTLERCLDWLRQQWGAVERRNSGSAVKFCQLVDGLGDFYPRFSPCCEWDTAAGQAVLEAAGGALLGMDGKPLRYNTQDSLLSPHFYGLAQPQHRLWRELLREH